jgi:hypothetical protein
MALELGGFRDTRAMLACVAYSAPLTLIRRQCSMDCTAPGSAGGLADGDGGPGDPPPVDNGALQEMFMLVWAALEGVIDIQVDQQAASLCVDGNPLARQYTFRRTNDHTTEVCRQ